MLMMTAKVDKKKLIVAVGALVLAIVALIALVGGGSGEAQPTSAPAAGSNEERVKFLTDLGWEVAASPVESTQVRIPQESSEVYDRYNALQQSQGYDLSKFAGKKVMRYVYEIKNYPDATEPVYATILVYKDQIIGGDITNTGPNGQVHGFSKP